MTKVTRKASLTPARKCLVEMMQKLNFGWIKHLVVRNQEPVFNPAPRVVRDVKFGSENKPRPEYELEDFPLKAEVLDLLSWFGGLEDGAVVNIEVKHGLPFRMIFEDRSEKKSKN